MTDFATLGRPYWVEGIDFPFEEPAVEKNLRKDPALRPLLPLLADRLSALESFTHTTTEEALRQLAEESGVKAGLLINGARTALTGQAVGPGIFDVLVAIGQSRTDQRLRHAVSLL